MIARINVALSEGAEMPVKAHEWDHGKPGDAGYDVKVRGIGFKTIEPIPGSSLGFLSVILDVGVSAEPTSGFRFMAVPNSRITKTGFTMANSPGTIDANYRGNIQFRYRIPVLPGDDIERMQRYIADEMFPVGSVCGQLVVVNDNDSILYKVDRLSGTARGDGGFGSTEEVRNV